MASCTTSQWVSSAPQIRLTVVENSSTATTSTLKWTLEYIASSAASTSVAKSYSVVVNGSTVGSGTYNINGKKGTYTIASNTLTINKTTAAQSISFSCSMDINIKWSGVSKSTISASGSISVPAKTSYKITYNANGGSSTPSAQTKWHGTNITLAAAISRTGYSFGGWNTKADGSGTNRAASSTYSDNASVTLYAKWTANTFTLSYDANGGSGAPGNQTKTYGVNLTLSDTIPTRTDYNFKGWATSASGSVAYQPGGTYTANAAVTLYAIWELAYIKPRISGLSIERCTSDGTLADDGTYASISFNWATDKTLASIKVSWKLSTETSYTLYKTVSASGTSGSISGQVVGSGELSTDSTYDFQIAVTDGGGRTAVYSTLAGTAYIIDILHDGTGITFGKPAETSNLLESAFPVSLNSSTNVIGQFRQTGDWIGFYNSHADAVANNNRLGWVGLGSTTSMYLKTEAGGAVYLQNGSLLYSFMTDRFRVSTNDSAYLGDSNCRWKAVYAVNGTIQSSDRNLKENIFTVSKKYEDLFNKLQPVTFEFTGNEHDRVHIGFIAQDVKAAMDDVDLSDKEFAAYCVDKKMEFDSETETDKAVLDQNGDPLETCSLRYTEFIALNTHMIQKQQEEIKTLKLEIESLKADIADLKASISSIL